MYNYSQTKGGRNCYSNSSPHQSQQSMSSKPLAMAYVPWQQFKTVYELNEALKYGTIFPELNLPFLGSKGGCSCKNRI